MRGVKAACDELAAQLAAAGFLPTLDPTELQTPGGVLIEPQTVGGFTLGGTATLTVWLYLVAANTDPAHAYTLLDDGLAGLLELDLSLSADDTVSLTNALQISSTGATLPAYRVAVDLDL
jgi:hypothetical protein